MEKKKHLILLLLHLVFAQYAFSQFNFQHLLGGPDHDRAQTIFSTFDNGFIVNGASLSFGAGSADAILIKTDNQGQTLWSFAYGTAEYDNSEFAIEASDHNIVCAGRSNIGAGQPTSATIFKTDPTGHLLWSKSYGGINNDGLVQIIETSDHGFAAIGNSQTLSSGSSDILLIRTDSNGDTIFTQSYGTIEEELGFSLIELPDNGFLISGRQTTFPGGTPRADGLLLRTNSSGLLLWSKQYGDSLWEELTAVRLLPDSGFIVAGSTTTFGAGGYDILLMKTDGSGNVQWAKTFGKDQTDAAYDIHLTADSSYVLSGYTDDLGYGHRGGDSSNVFLLKTNSTGDLQWMEVYGDGLQDEAFRSAKASDGGYLIPGFTTNYLFTDSSQMLFIKTDSMGLTGCHEETAQPVDSVITMPFQNIALNQLSGIASGNVTFTETPVTVSNDDACLFASLNEPGAIENEIIVSPNPFSDHFEIAITPVISIDNELYIYDICGKLIKSVRVVASKMSIETSDLKPGAYFITLNSTGKSNKSLIILKE